MIGICSDPCSSRAGWDSRALFIGVSCVCDLRALLRFVWVHVYDTTGGVGQKRVDAVCLRAHHPYSVVFSPRRRHLGSSLCVVPLDEYPHRTCLCTSYHILGVWWTLCCGFISYLVI